MAFLTCHALICNTWCDQNTLIERSIQRKIISGQVLTRFIFYFETLYLKHVLTRFILHSFLEKKSKKKVHICIHFWRTNVFIWSDKEMSIMLSLMSFSLTQIQRSQQNNYQRINRRWRLRRWTSILVWHNIWHQWWFHHQYRHLQTIYAENISSLAISLSLFLWERKCKHQLRQ